MRKITKEESPHPTDKQVKINNLVTLPTKTFHRIESLIKIRNKEIELLKQLQEWT